ncbi:METTL5 family protein [Pyrodictium occultum]|uniref:METTL5 family protein n=1 Tax=Pyrodictium occultum TaxID=2309 RepID=UPI001442EACA|nr:methyltransferase domain-containing protein [Pyrodictium occultum]
MKPLKVSRLAVLLEKLVPRLPRPKRIYEQYRTPPEIALDMALCIALEDCGLAVDLGSGTGMLSYAVSLVTAAYVVGIDIDSEVLEAARGSALYRMSLVDFVAADVASLPLRRLEDACIVENPPFGVSRRRVDRLFMEAGIDLGARLVCSLHYAGEGVKRYLSRLFSSAGYTAEFLRVYRFPIPAMYDGHVKRIHYIPVLLLKARKGTQSHGAEEHRGAGGA